MQTGKLNDFLRHRRHLLDQGLAPEQADKRLGRLFPEELASQVQRQRHATGKPSLVSQRLLDQADTLQLSPSELETGLDRASQTAAAENEGFAQAGKDMTMTVASTVTIAIVLALMMQIFVLPTYAQAYAQAGVEMPPLTNWVVSQPSWSWLIIAGLLLPLAIVFITHRQLHQLQTLQRPCSLWLRQLPAISSVAQRFEAAAVLRLYRMLREMGAKPRACQEACRQVLLHGKTRPNSLSQGVFAGLEQAVELDTESQEIHHWRRQLIDADASVALRPLQRAFDQIMLLLLGSAIGVYVVALYLAIFQLPALFS